MSYLLIGRMIIAPPNSWVEMVADPAGNLGGAVISAPRSVLKFNVSISTLEPDGAADTVAARITNRDQLRSMWNNTPLKLQGFCYVQYSDDPANNGWYVVDQMQLSDGEGSSGIATGWWKAEGAWYLVGHRRTNREARNVWMKDLRTGLYPRDTRRWLQSTDFSALPALALTILPAGASSIINTVSGAEILVNALPACRGGGQALVAAGLSDLACLSYERPDSSFLASDVIVYDRKAQITAPSTGPDTSWVEVYGADWNWGWIAATPTTSDTPVLDNGLCRVRYDASVGKPGLRVDVWNGSAYVEQGKVTFQRIGDVTGYDNTFLSSSLREYTPERAVVSVVLANSADTSSREEIFVTMQRGQFGATFECYPALKAGGTLADAQITWTTALADTNASLFKVDSQVAPPAAAPAGKNAATAGTGSALFGGTAALGSATFSSSENWVALLRCSAVQTITAYQANLAVVQAAVGAKYNGTDTSGYGSARNNAQVVGTGGLGYASLDVAFAPTSADQVMEAESMTLGTNTTSVADGAASNGNTTQSTRTTDANLHVSKATWPNGAFGVYRIWARVKTSASTLNIYAKTGVTTGVTQTTTSASYVWVDLGEVTATNTTLEIHCWATAAATVSVDRIEAVNTQDRTGAALRYAGARDLGQSSLMDSRQTGAVVAR